MTLLNKTRLTNQAPTTPVAAIRVPDGDNAEAELPRGPLAAASRSHGRGSDLQSRRRRSGALPLCQLMALLTLSALLSTQALALEIVATAPSMGALVRELTGTDNGLAVLAEPDRDLHSLQAKPSMIRALRDADLLVALGADLESGWLPAAINSAANRRIQPGQPGYFEAAAQVPLLDVGGPADRAGGDVHPVGNPHVDMDPRRMKQIADALAERLALLDPSGAEHYRRNATAFGDKVEARMDGWQRQLDGAIGVVLYHRDAVYLLDRFNVALLGTIEEVPGVPPSGSQLKQLANQLGNLQGGDGIILFAPYQSPKAPRKLAAELGWPIWQLPLQPPVNADGDGWLRHIDRWVDAIANGG